MIVSNFEVVQLNKYCKEILLVVSEALSYSLIQRRPMLASSPCHWANDVYSRLRLFSLDELKEQVEACECDA